MNEGFQILLADDEAHLHEVIRNALALDQVQVTSAYDAAEAFRLLSSGKYDLLLLDVGLPDLDGFQVLARLKESGQLQFLPVIVLTALASTQDKVKGLEAGASDYITKPVEVAELRARVRAVLRHLTMQKELRRANAELAVARDHAEAATRTKTRFLANISHEFRTPLNGVIATAGLLQESNLDPAHSEMVETIRQSGELLLATVNDILDFSRIETGQIELENRSFSLRNCLEEVVDLLAAKAHEKGLELIYSQDDGLPESFTGDSARLRQILINLIDNGIKFTERGEVVITVRGQPAESATPVTTTSSQSPLTTPALWLLHFEVRDTGMGIPVEKQGKLFQFFSQIDDSDTRKHGGTGLGLAISHSLVELMGGHIGVESTPGQGATFHFDLNLTAVDVPSTVSKPKSCLSSKRILVADDNTTCRNQLESILLEQGATVFSAGTIAEAIGIIERKNSLDALVVDAEMAGVEGVEPKSLTRGGNDGKSLPCLLLKTRAKTHPPVTKVSIDAGSFLTKPVKPRALLEALNALLVPRSPESPQAGTPRLDANQAGRQPLRILIVDDNIINQRILTRILQRMGYQPDTAANGIEALTAVRARTHDQYDVIFMDSQMPEMDGCAASRAIRDFESASGSPRSVIIAVTANSLPQEREKCLQAGMDDYLTKPIRIEVLTETLIRWADPTTTPHKTAGSAKPTPPAQGSVDVDRLNEFCDNDPGQMRELMNLYTGQTDSQLRDLKAAVARGDAEETRRLAHACCGASSQCGIIVLAGQMRELEGAASEGNLEIADKLLTASEKEFAGVRAFLDAYLAGKSAHT